MKITEIQIIPIKPTNGLIAFASCLIDENLYLGSIGIHTRPNGEYRLTYPTKNTSDKQINIFHPINSETGELFKKEIVKKYKEVMKNNDRYHQAGTAAKHVYHN